MGNHGAHNLNQLFHACWERALPAPQNEASLAGRAECKQESKKKKSKIKDKKENKPIKSIEREKLLRSNTKE